LDDNTDARAVLSEAERALDLLASFDLEREAT
jgi:hypothetical protein